ncbi:MAG: ATP-binding protein [Lysobacter sp.]|nr:ATP-binding protein [Lysobacter sp.]
MLDAAHTEAEHWSEANNRYLSASLHWLRLRLRQLAAASPPPSATMVPAMASTAATTGASRGVARWFARQAPAVVSVATPTAPAVDPDADRAALAQAALANEIDAAAAERAQAAQIEPAPALLLLAEQLGLGPFETDILLLCAAMELDPSTPGAIVAAQGGGGYPNFALAMQLFDHPAWDALAPQRPLRWLRLIEINQPGATPLTAAALRVDERVVNFIKGLNLFDERLSSLVSRRGAPPPISETQIGQADRLLGVLREHEDAALPVLQLVGADRGSRQGIAAHVAAALGRHLHVLPLESLPVQRAEVDAFARLWQRESLLLPIALYVEADGLDAAHAEANAALQGLLAQAPGLVFVGLRETPLRISAAQWVIDVSLPSPQEQHAAWHEALPPTLDVDDRNRRAEALSGHFRLNLEQIRIAAATARRHGSDVWDECRDLSLSRLDALAQRLDAKARWDDLVVGEEAAALLRSIAGQVHERHRVYQQWGYAERMNRGMGISALFAGESGTGKTMAAEVIANELRMHLYRIDLSSVVSKYIGETEKNLRRLFDAAEQGGAILFFDEADALFGKRSEVKDSHDRYANIEINYLLQRMEAFSGLAILATNMKSALDAAFMRRLRFVVNFQFPGPQERARIWRNAFAPGVPRETLDYDRLARFGLSGGNIHGIALNAAFAAAHAGGVVTMPLLLSTIRAELRKLDKPVNEAEFR